MSAAAGASMSAAAGAAARGAGAAMLGLDLGGTKIEALLLDAGGHERWRERIATPADDYAATLAAIAGLVGRGRAAAAAGAGADDAGGGGRPAGSLSAWPTIGIGTPGAESADGRMKNCNSVWLNGQPLRHDLQAALGQPVALANDANCLALSEATDGAGAGAPVVFAAILGTGVGAGIAVHGRVLGGPNGLAGEWGHNPLPWALDDDPRPACYCGQRGCIETLLSGPALARDFARAGGVGVTPDASPRVTPGTDPSTARAPTAAEIAALAATGDAAAQATLQRHASRLARALAGVINLLDPDVIVLGGGLSRMPHLYADVPRLWPRWVFSGGVRDPVRTRLVPALHGDASGVRGAAWLGRAAAAE